MTSSLPTTYRAAVVETPHGEFKIVEKPLVLPKDGQILVKVLACGVCHGDSLPKIGHAPLPRAPGHEVIGVIAAIPESEKTWKIGQRIGGGWYGGHCSECEQCRSGDFMVCRKPDVLGLTQDGGYAEYILIRREAAVSIPEGVDSAEAAPLLCAGLTTFNSLRHMDVHPGDTVAVQGIGGLGHLAIQFASVMGFRVIALSSSDSKRELSKALGADEYIDGSKVDQGEALQKLGGAKVILCTAPSSEAIKPLLKALKPRGTLVLLAAAGEIAVDSVALLQNGHSVRGWPAGTARDSEETISFSVLRNVKSRVEKYPLEKAEEAYQSMMTGKARFRAVISFD